MKPFILMVVLCGALSLSAAENDVYSGNADTKKRIEAESQIQTTEGDMGEQSFEKQKQEESQSISEDEFEKIDADVLGNEEIK